MSNNVATETFELSKQEIIELGARGGMLAGALLGNASVSGGSRGGREPFRVSRTH
jgi:hypothetical protein